MTVHQHQIVAAKRARQRRALLRFHHQKIGVAEFVVLIPERNACSRCRAQMKNRNERRARDAERHHRRRMMMHHRHHVRPRLVDFAVDDALGIKLLVGRLHRIGIRDRIPARRRARPVPARAIATKDSGSGRADGARDMPERVEHAFIARECGCRAQPASLAFVECVRHQRGPAELSLLVNGLQSVLPFKLSLFCRHYNGLRAPRTSLINSCLNPR